MILKKFLDEGFGNDPSRKAFFASLRKGISSIAKNKVTLANRGKFASKAIANSPAGDKHKGMLRKAIHTSITQARAGTLKGGNKFFVGHAYKNTSIGHPTKAAAQAHADKLSKKNKDYNYFVSNKAYKPGKNGAP